MAAELDGLVGVAGYGFHSLMFVLLNGGVLNGRNPLTKSLVSLADVCVTEWRSRAAKRYAHYVQVSLADVCVTEWREGFIFLIVTLGGFHSLMFVLLNGGACLTFQRVRQVAVSLADVCVTEWREKSWRKELKWPESFTR